MKKIITIFCLPFSLLFLQKATAQQINTAKLDSLFNILASKNLMMGSVAISKDDKIVYKKSFGYRYIDSSKKVLADENTKYRIGSITKLFTSVMIFQLVQEHKLSLDTKLATFFPQIKNADKITIADMMRHRSGIHDAINDVKIHDTLSNIRSEKEMLNILEKLPSDFEPDTKSAYSNSNFTLLGYIIERLDKNDYAVSLKKRIINKLKLKNTYVGGKTDVTNNESVSYYFIDGKWTSDSAQLKEAENNVYVGGGCGDIVSSPTDLNIFINALFEGKLINKQSLLLDTTIIGSFGMDISKVPFHNKYGLGHDGRIGGYISILCKFLSDNITIAICANTDKNNATNDIFKAIFSCCFNVPFDLSHFNLKSIIVDTTILKKYVGTYSSKEVPLKINVFIKNNQSYAQAAGQLSLPLTATSEKEFVHTEDDIDMVFDAEKNIFTLKQFGNQYLFEK